MATAAPTLVPSASSRRKGGKRPSPPESANGPPSIPENEMDLAKKIKLEPEDVAANVKVKKEPEDSPNDLPILLMPAGNSKKPLARTVSAFDWTSEDLTQLVANLSTCLPKADNVKYSTLIEKLDWEKIRFANFTAAQCKEKWIQIMTRLRRFRTLTDMVTDAREWLKHPWSSYTNSKKQKHPEMPKKPLTPYFRYFLEKREKYSREHPDMSMTDLAKLLSKKFQQLPEKKKQKYKESYEREIEVYRQELEKFKRDHPEEFPVLEPKHPLAAQEGPFKPLTPFQLFQGDRAKRPEYLEVDKKVFAERIRKQWTSLSDGKRIKWIRKAVQDELRYGTELMQYCEGNPNFKAERVKTVLSKAEKELKDRYDGKPDKPPNSGYSMFSKIMLRELKDVPAKEKMTEISRRWKLLSEADRDAYNKQVQKANVKYKEKYAAYLSSLVDEERQKAENEAKAIFAKKVENGNEKPSEKKELNGLLLDDGDGLNNRPKKPSSAMFFYQQEKYPIFHQKYPGLSKQELMRLMAREFSELSDKKKEKYRRLAEEERKKSEDSNKSKPKSEGQVEAPTGRKKLFKGEPRKPAQSGYGIFSTEMLSNLTEIDPKNRMAEIAKRWRVMPPPEKEKYKKKAQDLMKKYNKDHNKFLSTLTEEEMKEYQELRTKATKKSTAKAPATKTAAPDKVVKEEKKESESDSSDGEEDDDGSSDDDDSDQSDNDGDDSGSGSEESGSDSDDDDSEDDKKEGKNESSSADTDSDSDSGSSDDSSDSGSESEEQ